MQKRFCTCGFVLFVEYSKQSGRWTYTLIDAVTHHQQVTCPHCHRPLHIDALR